MESEDLKYRANKRESYQEKQGNRGRWKKYFKEELNVEDKQDMMKKRSLKKRKKNERQSNNNRRTQGGRNQIGTSKEL